MTKRNYTHKITAVAGAVALLSTNGHVSAQSSVEALLNKLEQKGILTVEEAKALKAENTQDTAADFNKALGSKFPMSDWVTSYKFSGDLRGRFDKFSSDNPAAVNRDRFRYRLRVGLAAKLKDNLEVGVRLGSGDAAGAFGGNPLSNNSTFQDNFTKKNLYVDTAYGKWTPLHDAHWNVAATIGKMDNPFRASNMMFDPDLTPEGGALQISYAFNERHSLSLNSAAFVMDELSLASSDPFMYGAQLIWDAKWTPKLESSLGVTVLNIVNQDALTTASVPYLNQGNTRMLDGTLANKFNPVFVTGSVTYKLKSFPFYPGAFPIKIGGEYVNNPDAAKENEGYWGGLTLGKAGPKKSWEISYRYQELQADAWYDQFEDDDNGAFYANAPAGGKIGYFGGTNIRGHLVKLNYCLTDSLTFTLSCYLNELANQNPGGVAEPQSQSMRLLADLMWKF